MLDFFKILSYFLNFNQEKFFNSFKIKSLTNEKISKTLIENYIINSSNIAQSTDLLINISNIVKSLIKILVNKFQEGLNITNVEYYLILILFIRLLILIIRYNLRTSFILVGISILTGSLWYRHLIEVFISYKNVLIDVPFLSHFGEIAIILADEHEEVTNIDGKYFGQTIHWYEPGQLIYCSVLKGLIDINKKTGKAFFIDPFSMILALIYKFLNVKIIEFYYSLYKDLIPSACHALYEGWIFFSTIAIYATLVRLGRPFCPYIIRWHWTLVLLLSLIEQSIIKFIERIDYFIKEVLVYTDELENKFFITLIGQIKILTFFSNFIIFIHIGFILFSLFHAIWSQFFYIPFIIDNVELHVGPRPTYSIYSGGNTNWQERSEIKKRIKKEINKEFPKLWYGWFGRGTNTKLRIKYNLKKFYFKFRIFLINLKKSRQGESNSHN